MQFRTQVDDASCLDFDLLWFFLYSQGNAKVLSCNKATTSSILFVSVAILWHSPRCRGNMSILQDICEEGTVACFTKSCSVAWMSRENHENLRIQSGFLLSTSQMYYSDLIYSVLPNSSHYSQSFHSSFSGICMHACTCICVHVLVCVTSAISTALLSKLRWTNHGFIKHNEPLHVPVKQQGVPHTFHVLILNANKLIATLSVMVLFLQIIWSYNYHS
jgi:hypothetical protein